MTTSIAQVAGAGRVAHVEQIELMTAVAAMYYLFRRTKDAIDILSAAEHIAEDPGPILEFKAALLVETHHYKPALQVIQRLEASGRVLPPEVQRLKIIIDKVSETR